ncbi:MAG: (Fe-S)-binding protein [Desulfobacterales bacterium]|nr:(Fe-S)-binding protein [Desulfobacterales bacterium]MBS3754095.1 (Fe-S)-binding protein [Desulfobacterales bacterium]
MFKQERCDLCGECLVKCQWIRADTDQATQWMAAMIKGEKTPVLDQCITCYACDEYCPSDAAPFDLIAELQEKYQVVPARQIEKTETRFSFSGELRDVPSAERIMSTCVFGKTDAHLIGGKIYDLPQIGGKPYFCWIMFTHMGAPSIQEKHAREFVDRLAATNAREIVCFHDDCYAMLVRYAPEYGIRVPFRPVHLSEYLVEYLSSHRNEITPLNMPIAYQRPCASRHTPEKEHFIDEMFELCGVQRVKRNYDGVNALCCAGIKTVLGMGDPRPDMETNIRDAKNAGAKALVCLCPMCMHALKDVAADLQMPLIFLGDLTRMAIGEIPRPDMD